MLSRFGRKYGTEGDVFRTGTRTTSYDSIAESLLRCRLVSWKVNAEKPAPIIAAGDNPLVGRIVPPDERAVADTQQPDETDNGKE